MRLSWERCAVGTPHPGYPSSCATVILDRGQAQPVPSPAPSRVGVGYIVGAPPRGCSRDAASTQEGRSPACQCLPCQGQEHLCGPRRVMRQGGGCQHHGNGMAQPQCQQPRYLPTPTVSQGCLFFPGPHALPRSPQLLPRLLSGDFNPAASTVCNGMDACAHPGTRCVPGAGGRICPC